MGGGDGRTDDERRDPELGPQQHVAQVWAASLADLDLVGLFRLGAACLDVAEATDDPGRRALLSTVSLSLLGYAGAENEVIAAQIATLCERERSAEKPSAETAHAIRLLARQFRAGGDPARRPD